MLVELLKAAVSPLYKALQQAVQDVAPVPHQLHVLRRAVHTLPVQNGTLKHVTELLPCTLNTKTGKNRQTMNPFESFHVMKTNFLMSRNRKQIPLCTEEVGSDEVDHAPVLDQVVLERVSGQHCAASGSDILQSLRCAGVAVLDAVPFVTDHHVRTGSGQGSLDTCRGTAG